MAQLATRLGQRQAGLDQVTPGAGQVGIAAATQLGLQALHLLLCIGQGRARTLRQALGIDQAPIGVGQLVLQVLQRVENRGHALVQRLDRLVFQRGDAGRGVVLRQARQLGLRLRQLRRRLLDLTLEGIQAAGGFGEVVEHRQGILEVRDALTGVGIRFLDALQVFKLSLDISTLRGVRTGRGRHPGQQHHQQQGACQHHQSQGLVTCHSCLLNGHHRTSSSALLPRQAAASHAG